MSARTRLWQHARVFTFDAPLRTGRATVRPFRYSDIDDLYAIRSNPAVVTYLPWCEQTREQAVETLKRRIELTRLERDGDAIGMAVERDSDGRVIGDISVWLRSGEHRDAEIGFVFHPDVHGEGYARESTAAVIELSFGTIGLHRVSGNADARNVASVRLMRALGMHEEAHLRKNEFIKGEWTDEVIFAVLREEWRSP